MIKILPDQTEMEIGIPFENAAENFIALTEALDEAIDTAIENERTTCALLLSKIRRGFRLRLKQLQLGILSPV